MVEHMKTRQSQVNEGVIYNPSILEEDQKFEHSLATQTESKKRNKVREKKRVSYSSVPGAKKLF